MFGVKMPDFFISITYIIGTPTKQGISLGVIKRGDTYDFFKTFLTIESKEVKRRFLPSSFIIERIRKYALIYLIKNNAFYNLNVKINKDDHFRYACHSLLELDTSLSIKNNTVQFIPVNKLLKKKLSKDLHLFLNDFIKFKKS